MLSLFCVSPFLLGSNLCCRFLIRLFRRGALLIRRVVTCSAVVLLIRRGVLLIRRGALLLCLLRRGGLLPCCSAVEVSYLVWSALVGSCSVCSAVEVSCPVCSAVEVSCPICSALVVSCPVCSAVEVSCPVCSALVGSCSVCSAVEVGCLALVVFCPVLVVFCSTVVVFCFVCSGLVVICSPWWSALLQCPVSPFPHGPDPPSLPLFRLCSTALLDCIGASGSRSLWGGSVTNPFHELPFTHHQRSPTHYMDSCTTLHFPSSIALTTRTQLITLITLTPENYHTITITQSHTLYKPWTFSLWSLMSIIAFITLIDSYSTEPK